LDSGGLVNDRLEEGKIDQLRAWGSGLASSDSDDLRATGKAILLLIEEIERLHIDLWNAKAMPEQAQPDQDGGDDHVEGRLDRTLRARLSRVRGR
jgi:hypothetical protein